MLVNTILSREERDRPENEGVIRGMGYDDTLWDETDVLIGDDQ